MRECYFPCSPYVFLFLLALGTHFPLAGQGTWQPGSYLGVPDKDRHTIVFDEFHDNRNMWNLDSRYMDMRISGGEFFCSNLHNNPIPKSKEFILSPKVDYQIEIRMRYVRGEKNTSLGMIFGADSKGNSFNFNYTPQGSYKISQYYNYRNTNLKNWMPHSSLSSHAYNVLSVRKVGKTWYFFINKNLVHKSEALPLFGNEFGFLISGRTSIEIDYFKIQELRTVDGQGPVVSLTAPNLTNNFVSTQSSTLDIRGYVKDKAGVKEITVNGLPVRFSRSGSFYAQISIESYKQQKPVTLIAEDYFGNKTQKQFLVQYLPPYSPTKLASSGSYTPNTSPTNSSSLFGTDTKPWVNSNRPGKNYILLIGVNEYNNWGNLNNAVKDCQDLAGVLTSYYQFDQENVIRLFNKQATRENILETFESLQEIITPNDNLLIYYAGHGYYDAGSHLGYWVPVGARQEKIPDYIRNSTIHDYLKTINSRHILLVADACYAGSLFATRSGIIDENNKSRWAFTSGNIEKVWDGEPGQNSPFAAFLINTLRQNVRPKLRASDLIHQVSLKVSRNTRQTPIGSALDLVGDEGGVFVFYRK
ncbi:MAG: caspase family protein [Bacteroidota bacterium]